MELPCSGKLPLPLAPVESPPDWRWTERAPLTLPDLLARLDGTSEPLDLPTLRAWLSDLKVQADELADYIRFDARHYQRNLIRRRSHYEMLVLCWLPGQRSPIHDHGQSNCAVVVINGEATEIRHCRDESGRLAPDGRQCFASGAVTASAGNDLHAICNWSSPAQNLITLHVYSPPLEAMATFPDEIPLTPPAECRDADFRISGQAMTPETSLQTGDL